MVFILHSCRARNTKAAAVQLIGRLGPFKGSSNSYLASGENPVPIKADQSFPLISVKARSHLLLSGDLGEQNVSILP